MQKQKTTEHRSPLGKPRGARWGFLAVVFFMLAMSALLIVSADSRFSGTAWGNSVDWNSTENVSVDGFMVVDLSEVEETKAASVSGAAYAAQFGEGLTLPGELALAALPDIEPSLELPASAKVANLPLPSLIEEPAGDFGPLPKDLEDFEAIVLNTTDDGLKLPEDTEADTGLPDDEVTLAEVNVNWKEHVVKTGETLSDIATQYGGLTAQDIMKANALKDANRLSAKQILLIPNTPDNIEDTLEEVMTRKARVAALREQVVPLKIISYVVAAGDSLWSIANSQNIEVDTLVGSNTFKDSSLLHPGTALRIPNQDGIFYVFKSGDKIEAVAKRYKVSVDKIRQVNPTTDLPSLKKGSEIFLPGARPEAIEEAPRKTNSAASKPAGGGSSSGSTKSSRTLRWPVMGKINSPFGWRRHPITRRSDFHTGLDIKAGRGVVIRSAGDGKVAYAGWMGGYGKVVVVEHSGGRKTLYAHCSSIQVRQGAKVSSGQNIARVGSTGRTTGPHLHFEVRNGNKPANPLQYLK